MSERNLAAELAVFKDSIKDLGYDIEYIKYPEFQILTAAVLSLMKGHNFTDIRLTNANNEGADKSAVEKDLLKFGIRDSESAKQSIGTASFRGAHWQYAQFDMYDKNADFRAQMETRPGAKAKFLKSKEFSDQFKAIVGDPGYIAYDMAFGVDLMRESVFCDYFDEMECRKMMDDLMKPLISSFKSWADFAVSFIAGGTYLAYKNSDFNLKEAESTFDTLTDYVKRLFKDDNANVWKHYNFYKKKEYFPMLDKDNLKHLVNSEQACIVSDRISIDGALPCRMYREEPFKNFPDSGWRFFAGDESREYIADRENTNIFPLNVLANFDETIIKILDSEVNSAYVRKGDSDFALQRLNPEQVKERAEAAPYPTDKK